MECKDGFVLNVKGSICLHFSVGTVSKQNTYLTVGRPMSVLVAGQCEDKQCDLLALQDAPEDGLQVTSRKSGRYMLGKRPLGSVTRTEYSNGYHEHPEEQPRFALMTRTPPIAKLTFPGDGLMFKIHPLQTQFLLSTQT
ncbi:hypothetical protein ACRALDRAFT_207412 [Sodiomyces alcalophilus JCM 7366]|uniref:uncharacterized protein n=1 Tax=Sodiomyces alcalophilus JCM 7366 TaxID=591952 RepID=UPI0039B4A77C